MQSIKATQDGRSSQNPKKLTYKEVLTGFKHKTCNSLDEQGLSSVHSKSDYSAIPDQCALQSLQFPSSESNHKPQTKQLLSKPAKYSSNSSEKYEPDIHDKPETFSPSHRKVFPRQSKNVPFTPQVSQLSGSKERNLSRSPRIQSNSNSPGLQQHRKPGSSSTKKHKSRALFNTPIRKVDELIYLPSCNGREESTVYFFPEKFSMPCYSFDMVFYDHLALVLQDKEKGKIFQVLVYDNTFSPLESELL